MQNKYVKTHYYPYHVSYHVFFSGPVESKIDDGLSVKLVEIFITRMPFRVLIAPNLRYPCINLLTQALQSQNESVI